MTTILNISQPRVFHGKGTNPTELALNASNSNRLSQAISSDIKNLLATPLFKKNFNSLLFKEGGKAHVTVEITRNSITVIKGTLSKTVHFNNSADVSDFQGINQKILEKANLVYSNCQKKAHPTPSILSKGPVQKDTAIDVPPAIPNQEKGFSSFKYFIIACAIASLAAFLFSLCLPASIVLFTVAAWYLFSAVTILANQAATGTSLETSLHRLHATVTDINASITAAFLFLLTFFKSYHDPRGNPHGQPILMVNGYMSFGSTWDYQRNQLAKAGFGPIYTINVGSGKSIESYAQEVQEKIEEIKKETGRNDLILIAHSKGGLVSAYYATHLAQKTNTNITDVITIGSPFSGTPIAHMAPGDDAQQMRLDASFHKNLREKMKGHSHTRFSHIASESDVVVPLSSALSGKEGARQYVLKDMGHMSLLFSSRVADQICVWLIPK